MKKFSAILLAVLLTAVLVSACHININVNQPATEPVTQPAADSQPAAPATEAPSAAEQATEAPVGSVESYVADAMKSTLTLDDGKEHVYRYPQIVLNSDDADDVNDELDELFRSDVPENKDQAAALIGMDYEAFLNGTTLSVVATVGYNGGNTYGAAYNFDVVSGSRLSNEAVAKAHGESYDEALADLRDELSDYYEEKWGALPGNDAEKAKTLADDNVKAATLYLDGDGDLMALIDVYAAVGGGHWIAQLDVD